MSKFVFAANIHCMRKFLVLLLSLLALSASAQESSQKSKVVCGPYLQNVTTTGFTVMWISDVDAVAWVEVAPEDGQSFYYADRPKFYDLSGSGIKPVNKVHKVTVSGLEPGTRYRYRIMMKAVDKYYHFLDINYGREYGANVYSAKPPVVKTLESEYKEVKFSVVNDIHEKDSLLRRLFSDQEKTRKMDFVVFNGDMTSSVTSVDKIVQYDLTPACELFASELPFYMVRGNHEFRGRDAIHFPEYFDFPSHGPYYTFKYGNYFFLVMDSGEDKPDNDIEYQDAYCTDPYLRAEAEWLKGIVASEDWKNAEKRIVFSHIPPQTTDAWHGNWNMSNLFLPVLNGASVDLMICGHRHSYAFEKVGVSDAKFPVLVNSNCERADVKVSPKSISIEIFNPDGKKIHSVKL